MKRVVVSAAQRAALERALVILEHADFNNAAEEIAEYLDDESRVLMPLEMLQAKLDDLEFWHIHEASAPDDKKRAQALRRIAPAMNKILTELDRLGPRPTANPHKLTYADVELTGRQDCANVFDLTNFDLSSGDAERAFDSYDWDATSEEWMASQDDLDDLDPKKAWIAWLGGWRACALPRLRRAIAERAERDADDEAFSGARRNPAKKGAASQRGRAQPAASGSAQRVVSTIARDAGFPRLKVESPNDVRVALTTLIGARASEYFAVLFVNPRNIVLGFELYTMGSPSSVAIHPQGILAAAIGVNASALITAHNHPSGDATPSPDDYKLWSRLSQACDVVGLALLDNLVVSDTETSFYSQAETGGVR